MKWLKVLEVYFPQITIKWKQKYIKLLLLRGDDLKLEINLIGEILTEGDKIDEDTAWHLCNYTCWNGNPERKLPEVGSEIKWDDHIFIPTDKFLGFAGGDIALQISKHEWAVAMSVGWKYFKYKKSAMKCLKTDTYIAKVTKRIKESKK